MTVTTTSPNTKSETKTVATSSNSDKPMRPSTSTAEPHGYTKFKRGEQDVEKRKAAKRKAKNALCARQVQEKKRQKQEESDKQRQYIEFLEEKLQNKEQMESKLVQVRVSLHFILILMALIISDSQKHTTCNSICQCNSSLKHKRLVCRPKSTVKRP